MKKVLNVFFMFSVSAIILLSLFGCANGNLNSAGSSSRNNSDISHSGNAKTPSVITDLFDGDEKIWFYVDDDSLSYESEVLAVLVIENKYVTKFYYTLLGNARFPSEFIGENPNPCSNEPFKMEDFAGLSDNEIIEKVSGSYGDASKDYAITYAYADVAISGKEYTSEDYKNKEEILLSKSTLPYEIKYNGDLDSSGNNLKSEELSFIDNIQKLKVGVGNAHYESTPILCENYDVDSIITPTEIKDKTYIGIKDDTFPGSMLVSENIYSSFGNIKKDNPSGISEW